MRGKRKRSRNLSQPFFLTPLVVFCSIPIPILLPIPIPIPISIPFFNRMVKVFSSNPLSLSLSDEAFETWLRDKGYLEILDERTASISTIHHNPLPSSSDDFSSRALPFVRFRTAVSSFLSVSTTLVSLLTLNPFAKLTNEDFAGDAPSWTVGFVGLSNSYSWPTGPAQARMRVHENVKRYARNYAWLSLIFFACSLYQMTLALLGAISSLALWEAFRYYGYKLGLERHPSIHLVLLRLWQFATAVILYSCNFQVALFCTIGVSYAVMILHASLRKLTPSKQANQHHNRFLKNKYRT